MKKPRVLLALMITFGLTASVTGAEKKAAKPAPKKEEKPKPKSVFTDKNLEKAVRQQVFAKRNSEEPLTADDVAQVAIVTARGMKIKSLAGLEHCRALASIDLGDNAISDLTALSGLPRLQQLILSTNQVTDLAPLKENHALQYLDLNHNQAADLKPLAGLTNLAVLYASDNPVASVAPVVKLPKLYSLYLDRTQLKSVEGLGQLRRLSSFSAAGNRITDLSPLKGLDSLSFLFLEQNQIQDLSPLLELLKGDYEGRQLFAPYLNIHLKGNPLNDASKEAMEKFRREYRTRFR
jgi:internalin A